MVLLHQELRTPPNTPFFLPPSRHSPSPPAPQILWISNPSLPTPTPVCSGVGNCQQEGAGPFPPTEGSSRISQCRPSQGERLCTSGAQGWNNSDRSPLLPHLSLGVTLQQAVDVTNALCPSGAGSAGVRSPALPRPALPCSDSCQPPLGAGPSFLSPSGSGARVPGLYKESFVWVGNNCSPLYGNMGCVS